VLADIYEKLSIKNSNKVYGEIIILYDKIRRLRNKKVEVD